MNEASSVHGGNRQRRSDRRSAARHGQNGTSAASGNGTRLPQFTALKDSKSATKFATLFAAAAKGPSIAGRGLIQAYRYSLSAVVGRTCRHLPTCSEYGDDALARHGLWAGGWMTLARIARCHPWGTSGLDFVPEDLPASSRWYLPWRYGRWRGVNEHAGGARRCRRRARAL